MRSGLTTTALTWFSPAAVSGHPATAGGLPRPQLVADCVSGSARTDPVRIGRSLVEIIHDVLQVGIGNARFDGRWLRGTFDGSGRPGRVGGSIRVSRGLRQVADRISKLLREPDECPPTCAKAAGNVSTDIVRLGVIEPVATSASYAGPKRVQVHRD
jgi:hypothetical protein